MDDTDKNHDLLAGPHSAFLIHSNGTWEQITFEVPAGVSESDFVSRILGSDRRVLFVFAVSEDPDAPEDCIAPMPGGDQ